MAKSRSKSSVLTFKLLNPTQTNDDWHGDEGRIETPGRVNSRGLWFRPLQLRE
jgi:hypothetical protein